MQRECASTRLYGCHTCLCKARVLRPGPSNAMMHGQYNEPRPDGEKPERLELGWVVVRSRRGRR
eukprot:403547-Prymnesium_polylepis.1